MCSIASAASSGGKARVVLVPGLERNLPEASRDVEALDALDARRLQGDLVVAAAEQHVGAEAETGRGGGASAHIGAGERALLHVARREHQPDHVGALGEADVDAVLLDLAAVALRRTVMAREQAAQALGRAEDEARP